MNAGRALLPALAAITPSGDGREIGRRAAQRLARRELAKTGFWDRALRWLTGVVRAGDHAVVGSWAGRIVLLALAILVVGMLARWTWPRIYWSEGRPRHKPSGTTSAPTASQYRFSARRHADAGDFSEAILDSFRAIAAGLEERKILSPDPGRTADEFAAVASHEFPAHSSSLRQVARLFDDVRYGDQEGTQEGYHQASQAEHVLRSASTAAGQTAHEPTGDHDDAVPATPAPS